MYLYLPTVLTQLALLLYVGGLYMINYFYTKLAMGRMILYGTAFAVLGLSTFYTFYTRTAGSVFLSDLLLAFILVFSIYILRFIRLNLLDYSILFSIFLFKGDLMVTLDIYLGQCLFILIIFIGIISIYKVRLKVLKGNIFNAWLTFILLLFESYFYNFLFGYFVRKLGYYFESPLAKLTIWAAAACLAAIMGMGFIYVLKRIFHTYFYEINQMGKRYPSLEKYFIYITFGILFCILFIHLGFVLTNGYNFQISNLLTIFCILALNIQLIYLTLIFRVSYLKENLQNKELENETLSLYSSHLEKNMDTIREIKHDIKNIFFTMGRYIEESGNEEMKSFYYDKIYPFASGEIMKNDLHGKLVMIPNEHLKAFLFYKILQGMERNIEVHIEINLQPEDFRIPIDFTDFIRILGIWMDNAIEECTQLSNGEIWIKISQNQEIASYTVKNTISPETASIGIQLGRSTKGESRGKGLLIVKDTVEKYDNVTINSYVKDHLYVQNLSVYLGIGE